MDAESKAAFDRAVSEFKRQAKAESLSWDQLLDIAAIMSVSTQWMQQLLDEQGIDHRRTLELLSAASADQSELLAQYGDAVETVKILSGMPSKAFRIGHKMGKAIAPKKGAHAMHKEDRALKAEAFAWFDQHAASHSSMDDAAMAAMKVVPMKFSTLRAWMTQWKKLRSASKP